jgi:BolA protein
MRKADRIHDLLVEHFSPVALQVIDESHMHAPRPGGESHFKVVVVSDAFAGKAALARHRSVHAALDELLAPQAIHALSVHAWTPAEWTGRGEVVPSSPPCRGGAKG